MKARVKATGKIVGVEKDNTDYPIMRKFGMTLNVYKDSQNLYNPEELEFLDNTKDNQNITEKSFPKDNNYFYLDFLISSIIAKMPASTTLIAIIIIVDLSGVLRLNRACAPANPKKKYFNDITCVFLKFT